MERNIITLIILTLFLIACDNPEKSFNVAVQTNTIEAFESFIIDYPQSSYIAEANTRIQQLKEEMDWNQTLKTNAVDDYLKFIERWPQSKRINNAKKGIHLIEIGELIELTCLEWFKYWEHPTLKNVQITNKKLLDRSELKKAKMIQEVEISEDGLESKLLIFSTTDQIISLKGYFPDRFATMTKTNSFNLKKTKLGIGFSFNDKWTIPIITEGNKLPKAKFRSGSVNILNGSLIIQDSTMTKISDKEYVYLGGRWNYQ